MKIARSTVLLLIILSSCSVYTITYQHSNHAPTQVPVSLSIKPAVLDAVVDIKPEMLSLHRKGRWVTCYIELPEGYEVDDIDVSTVMLNDTIPVYLLDVPAPHPVPTEIGDYDEDDIPDLMVKFDGATVISYIWVSLEIETGNVTLTVSGQLCDGTSFEGSDTIRALLAGDTNGDNIVNVIDLSIVGRGYGAMNGEDAYEEEADLNSDRIIDMRDIYIVAINLGATIRE